METRLHDFKYFVREALTSMTRNKILNGIAISMIAVSLAIFGIFLLIYINLNTTVRHWSNAVHIVAYLKEPPADSQRTQLEAQIRVLEYVRDLTYVSPETALKEFKTRLGDYADLVNGLDSNPLPASYQIQLTRDHRDVDSVRSVVEALQKMPAIEDVQYGQQWLESLTTIVTMLRFVGIFLGSFLFLTVIFIIANTIKLTLYTREEELNIMKFIGATESFIKGPFLAEGVIRGFLGAVLSLLLLASMYKLFLMLISYSAQSVFIFSAITFFSWPAIISITLLGSLLGWCGSLVTMHKYLKTF
jgi:cell division transport system permease protein